MLKDKEWHAFFIGGDDGLFDISSSKSSIDKRKIPNIDKLNAPQIPYITRSNLENGFSSFVHNLEEYNYSTDESGVITIGLDTQTIFFQPYKFYTGQNIQVLRHENLNKFSAAFLIPLLKIQMQKFSWGGNGATLGRLFKTKIVLPVNAQGQPDWMLMENYIRRIWQEKQEIYKIYATKANNKLSYKEIPSLKEKKWKEFSIGNIAKIKSGKRLTKSDMIEGKIPFIGSVDSNNGITSFIANKNSSADKNVLGVNYNGSVVENFYHPYMAVFSDDVKRLSLKKSNANKYMYLFLKSCILKQKYKYRYAYKFNEKRLVKQKIVLPINEQGEPDYDYMAQYMMNIEVKKRQQYFDYQKTKGD